ncbi:carbonic anhydrase [Harmonia axyridis]|uniref:carbonic anhydrase n=1 Tax=Harmonia axyridis TaxID=115357 RepID=UPI001E279CA7|nr:carbonic anhydrase [Harmonia axyridis]XP_045465048.1 carbonic anhydrase [Harmonia axyridis]
MSHHWGYCNENGPETWLDLYPAARGEHQSPVDIKPVDLKLLDSNKKLEWQYTPEKVKDIRNTGHAWQVDIIQGGSSLSGGPMKGKYELAQIHCHWGEKDDEGSEHSIEGKKFAAELHMVHWNSSKYSSLEEAAEHPDGFCVFGVFLKPGAKHEELDKIVAQLPKIQFKGQRAECPALNPANLLPKDMSYYTYCGSLTTPPCLECVIWIVFKEPIEVSQEQLAAFRNLKFHPQEEDCPCKDCDGSIKANSRPTLPLGPREVLEGC